MIEARSVAKTFRVRENSPKELKERVVAWVRREYSPARTIQALDDISLAVGAGEAVALIGNNGAGKSTLLRCLAGILQPTSGVVVLNGRLTALLDLAAGFQPQLSGLENIFLLASLHGIGRQATAAQVDSIVQFSELQEFVDLPLKVYSAGMILRLAFAISVHVEADILLIDESLSVGDHDFQRRCLTRMNELRDHGSAVVLATHDFTTAKKFCSRALLLHDGRCVEKGSPEEVCSVYERHFAGASARLGGARHAASDAPERLATQ